MTCHMSVWKMSLEPHSRLGKASVTCDTDISMGGDLIEDYDDFLFQVREQLGEITKQAQQEQNGPADAQVRVQRSQGTLNFLSGRSGQ